MALQPNPFALKKPAFNTNNNNNNNTIIKHNNNSFQHIYHKNSTSINAINNNNLSKNITLPLTIIPLTEDALMRQQQQQQQQHQQLLNNSAEKPPDLTFHCMCCEEYFVNPFHMYEHLNTKHADLPESQVSEEDLEDGKDYSWVFEPLCELVAEEGAGGSKGNENNNEDVSSSSSSSDSDSDDDDDSSSTSSSSSSSTSSASSSNVNSNSQDEATRDANEIKKFEMENINPLALAEVMEEAAYEEVPEVNYINKIKMEPLDDSGDQGPVLVLNPAANTTITPVLPQIRRGRGRRSAAQQAAIEMSSLISGEPKCFQCSHCEASFPSAGDLSKHVRCHITNKPFQCSICDKTFTHIGSLNTHIRIHSGEKPYKCDLCSKAFTQSSSLMVHIRSHSIKKPHQCHLCDKGFVNFTSLAIHLKTHNETNGAVYNCPECSKTFKLEAQLHEHMRMHTLSLVYQCSICRQAFASSSELVQHMKCHMGEKPFTCSICDRAFTQSGSLNIHMRIHTGEKPFNCKFCNKSFTQASSLSVHLKIHSGDKPFPCHICGKSYSQAAYLNKHIQNHLEEQKIKQEPHAGHRQEDHNETLLCIVCGELHRDANSLAMHVTRTHAALLNNMQGQINNSNNMEISEEERLKQEQMYMQQIQMLMQMQQQMGKPTLNSTMRGETMAASLPGELNQSSPMRSHSGEEMIEENQMPENFNEKENMENMEDNFSDNEDLKESTEEIQKHNITQNPLNILNGNENNSIICIKENLIQNFNNNNSNNEIQNTKISNDLNLPKNPSNESNMEDLKAVNPHQNENEKYLEENPQFSNGNEKQSPISFNGNTKELNGIESNQNSREESISNGGHLNYERENIINSPVPQMQNGQNHITYNGVVEQMPYNGVVEQQDIVTQEYINDNSQTMSIYHTNSQEYSDNEEDISQSPPHSQQSGDQDIYEDQEMSPEPNDMNYNGNINTSEYHRQEYVENNNNHHHQYEGVIRHHQSINSNTNNDEYQCEPEYDNDNGMDGMDAMQEDINESYGNEEDDDDNDVDDEDDNDDDDDADTGVVNDINGHDIEMSDYPFVDDTKFNFYDDYAAEEEVETAE